MADGGGVTGVEILSLVDRDRWNSEHAAGGLPSQSWNFAWGLSASGIEPKLAIVRSGGARMLLPFFERHYGETVDIATIPAISGASISRSSGAPLLLWHEFAAKQRWVAGYIRLAITVDLGGLPVAGRLVRNNLLLVLDLRDAPVLESFSRTIRRKILGAKESEAILVTDRQLLSEALKRLYPLTMRRVGAASEFAYTPKTLERWALDPSSELLGAAVNGSIELAHLFLVAGSHAESHILGCTDRGRPLTAWLTWKAIRRLRNRGVTVLNLTGGMRPSDGIYRFKAGFNARPTPKRAVYQVYDQATYDELCAQSGVAGNTEWFPAYRALR